MLFQLREFIAELLPTPPTLEVLLQIALSARVSPHIRLRQRQVIQWNEEWRGEAVVMFPVLQTRAVAVFRNDVDVQMIHRRVGVHSDHDLCFPIPPSRDSRRRRVGIEGFVSGTVKG